MTHRAKSVDIIPTELVLSAYAGGYFPMSEPGSESVQWYYSDPSAIIPLDSWKIPRSLNLHMKKCGWKITSDREFHAVIRACARRRNTWISDIIVRSYINLNREGHAHSVEVWDDEILIGGLYGISLGSAFFGESMFHRKTNASKVALAALLQGLTGVGFTLLDIQMLTPVMEQFGAVSIARNGYLQKLERALKKKCTFPIIDNFAGKFVH
jgi:leucyl/phenylalanyl-tRNA---protein transferase